MHASSARPAAAPPQPRSELGRQLAGAAVGALVGAVLWYVLAVPQHLINVIFSVLVGLGAGFGAGKLSGASRSGGGIVLAVLVTAIVILVTQAVVTKAYLGWATSHLAGAPASPSWDGPIGGLRLALDRAAGRNGWTANASYFYWLVSLGLAGTLSWYTAKRPGRWRHR